MDRFNQTLLIFHFLGLAMGFSVSFANIVMLSVIAKAVPADKAVLARFLPVMSKVGKIGLVFLWLTGVTMVYTKWSGFGSLPWQFHVKLTAVVLLSVTVGFIDVQERKMRNGDAAAAARVQAAGKVASTFALIALIFAVLSFG